MIIYSISLVKLEEVYFHMQNIIYEQVEKKMLLYIIIYDLKQYVLFYT